MSIIFIKDKPIFKDLKENSIVACQSNLYKAMGRGLEASFYSKFKGLKESYKLHIRNKKEDIFVYHAFNVVAVLIPTKYSYTENYSVSLLERSLECFMLYLKKTSYFQARISLLGHTGYNRLSEQYCVNVMEKYLSNIPNIFVYL